MYNWINDLEEIYSILENKGCQNLREELFNTQLSGGIGWEIFLLVTAMLKKVKKENPTTYEYIKLQANRILDFGIKNGYINL